MKRILITGKGSYIGEHVKIFLSDYPHEYEVEELDMLGGNWENFDFSNYDIVFHVAGLAHSTPDESQRDLYYEVNTDLVYKVAKKSKKSGIKQFIFMSSIIVFGSGTLGTEFLIDENTVLNPDNFYGDSKKQAEIKIRDLDDDNFHVVILRPPMIYGPGSKGNYAKLSKLSKRTPVFPNYSNKRSMLYIDHLSEFIRLMIENDESGIFYPQNIEYVETVSLVKEIANVIQHHIFFIKLFNPFIKLLHKQKYVNKLFGNMIIDKQLSCYKTNYNLYDFKETIRRTEMGE